MKSSVHGEAHLIFLQFASRCILRSEISCGYAVIPCRPIRSIGRVWGTAEPRNGKEGTRGSSRVHMASRGRVSEPQVTPTSERTRLIFPEASSPIKGQSLETLESPVTVRGSFYHFWVKRMQKSSELNLQNTNCHWKRYPYSKVWKCPSL